LALVCPILSSCRPLCPTGSRSRLPAHLPLTPQRIPPRTGQLPCGDVPLPLAREPAALGWRLLRAQRYVSCAVYHTAIRRSKSRHFLALAQYRGSSKIHLADDTGPYAGSVLRFTLVFPTAFPRARPGVYFDSDVFHRESTTGEMVLHLGHWPLIFPGPLPAVLSSLGGR
jgi:hypothetical protein